MKDDWDDDRVREAVMAAGLGGARVSLVPLRACPHTRSLTLRFEDGSELSISPDQGMGAWRALRPPPFDGRADPAQQVAALLRATFSIEMAGAEPSPIWMVHKAAEVGTGEHEP